MVVLVVHVITVAAVEAEGNPPGAIDIDGPLALATSFEWMKPQTGRIEISNTGRRLKPSQNPTDLRNVIRIQTSHVASFKEPPQSAVFESDDHRRSVTRNGSRVNEAHLFLVPLSWEDYAEFFAEVVVRAGAMQQETSRGPDHPYRLLGRAGPLVTTPRTL